MLWGIEQMISKENEPESNGLDNYSADSAVNCV